MRGEGRIKPFQAKLMALLLSTVSGYRFLDVQGQKWPFSSYISWVSQIIYPHDIPVWNLTAYQQTSYTHDTRSSNRRH